MIMDGLIFNCTSQELNLTRLFLCGSSMYLIAEKRIKADFERSQELLDMYIDLVTADEESYIKKLRKSKTKIAAEELEMLEDCKKIMDIKYWRNYSWLLSLCKDHIKPDKN